MNTGILASRYSRALLKLVSETGGGEKVLRQAEVLLKTLDESPDFRRLVSDERAVTPGQKLALFEAALDGEEMAPEMRRFLSLLMKNDRIGDCRLMLRSFVSEYYRSRGIRHGVLRVASPDPSLERTLDALIESDTGWNLQLETEVDPDLIGGFVLEIEDYRMDASVAGELERLRRRFIEKNRTLY